MLLQNVYLPYTRENRMNTNIFLFEGKIKNKMYDNIGHNNT